VKQTIKTIVIWIASVVRRDASPKVVFYHDVGTRHTPMGTPAELFWSHMACLAKANASLVRLPTSNLRSQVHRVCFDDGFRGIWDERERFREMNLLPTVFLAIDLVGAPGYLTWDEIRVLQDDYGFDFQCHTWSHQTLVGPVNADLPVPAAPDFRTDDWYRHELVDSKRELERRLGRGVDSLCFPVGRFSDDVVRRCAAAGYRRLYASFPGNGDDASSIAGLNSRPVVLVPRCLCQHSSLFEFGAILRGGLNPFGRRYLKMQMVD